MCIIFLTNSSPSHCRLTVTNNIFFISYIGNVKTVNTFHFSYKRLCDSFTDWGKIDDKVDKLLLVKLNKKVDELIMLECPRSPHVAIFANELFNKTL